MASTEMESCQTPSPIGDNDSEPVKVSKKQAKKEAQKAERLRMQQEATAIATAAEASEVDPFIENYGDVPTEEIQSKVVSGRRWTEIRSVDAELADRTVLIRGVAQAIRPVSKKMAFLVVRQYMSTIQCVLVVNKECVSPQMVKFATGLSKESIIDIEGVVSIPKDPVKGTTQQVEVQVRKLFCINRAVPNLPINIEDAA